MHGGFLPLDVTRKAFEIAILAVFVRKDDLETAVWGFGS